MFDRPPPSQPDAAEVAESVHRLCRLYDSRLAEIGGDLTKLTGPMITQAAAAGDATAAELLAEIGSWLGTGLANLASAFDPGAFVIGGGVSAAGEMLLTPAREAFRKQLCFAQSPAGADYLRTLVKESIRDERMAALGLEESFEDICCIITTGFTPKPDPRAYAMMVEQFGIDPARAFFVDDMAHNLKPAHALGMATAWVNNGSERGDHGHHPDFIDFEMTDLTDWLEELTA